MLGWLCSQCNKKVMDSDYHHIDDDNLYCYDCAFISGYISEPQYLKSVGICISNIHATYRNGEIIIWQGKKPLWEKSDSDMRNTPRYREWRTAVFERDNYTCQTCNIRGGELEAHHILSYKTYKEKRYEVVNGKTYCKRCHKNIHRLERLNGSL